jgi:hypothetical protein
MYDHQFVTIRLKANKAQMIQVVAAGANLTWWISLYKNVQKQKMYRFSGF